MNKNQYHQQIYNDTFEFFIKQLRGCDFWFVLFVLEDVAQYKARKATTPSEKKAWDNAAIHLRAARKNVHV